jgi:hypothetical protein
MRHIIPVRRSTIMADQGSPFYPAQFRTSSDFARQMVIVIVSHVLRDRIVVSIFLVAHHTS